MRRSGGNTWYGEQQAEQRLRSQPRRGLRRAEAATFVGVSVEQFDELVEKGLMPQPKAIPGSDNPVWDIVALDLFFTALPDARARQQSRSPSQ